MNHLAVSDLVAIHRCIGTKPVRSPGIWCEQRSGIKGEAAGRRTAAELFTPSAMASTAQALKAYEAYYKASLKSVLASNPSKSYSSSYAINSIVDLQNLFELSLA
jgi:hypothetical protein